MVTTEMNMRDANLKLYTTNFEADLTPVQQMASSCAGAFVVSLFMTPLDVVKIRLQAQVSIILNSPYSEYSTRI